MGFILGQQEIGQLVALIVHRPQGVVGTVIIGQRTAGNDEFLALVTLSAHDRVYIHMRTVPNSSGRIGANRIDAFEEIAFSDKSAVIHGKSCTVPENNSACTFCSLRKVQLAILINQNTAWILA